MLGRQGWVLGLAVALLVAPAFGQTPSGGPSGAKPPAKRVTVAQSTATSDVPRQPGVPRTLAEALAATYANQPALQAERAKLRATDENCLERETGRRQSRSVSRGLRSLILRGCGLTVPKMRAQRLHIGGIVAAPIGRPATLSIPPPRPAGRHPR
jgi:hypothetical protein